MLRRGPVGDYSSVEGVMERDDAGESMESVSDEEVLLSIATRVGGKGIDVGGDVDGSIGRSGGRRENFGETRTADDGADEDGGIGSASVAGLRQAGAEVDDDGLVEQVDGCHWDRGEERSNGRSTTGIARGEGREGEGRGG